MLTSLNQDQLTLLKVWLLVLAVEGKVTKALNVCNSIDLSFIFFFSLKGSKLETFCSPRSKYRLLLPSLLSILIKLHNG